MRLLKMMKLGIFVFACTIVLMSCGEDGLLGGLATPDNGNDNEKRSFLMMFDDKDSIDLSCAEIVYPITLNNADGSTTTVNDEDEFIDAIEDAILNDDDVPTIAFPIQVINEDGVTETVADEDELFEIFEACFGDWDDDCGCDDDEFEECFEINYPITLVMPDGSQVSVNDDEELETAIDNYYTANPNDSNDISVVYPITVTMFEDSSTVTINNDEEFDELFEACFDEYFEECFEIQYPISILMPDNTTITANSEEELDSLYDAWIIANPNDTGEVELIFPITVVYEDGTTEVVNDEDELEELYEECYGDDFCEMVGGTDIVIGTAETTISRVAMKKKVTAASATATNQ